MPVKNLLGGQENFKHRLWPAREKEMIVYLSRRLNNTLPLCYK